MTKYCNKCRVELIPNANWLACSVVNGQYTCRSCKAAYLQDWRSKNPGAFRKNKYGITQEQFEELLSVQDYKCAICRTDKPGGRYGWHMDHNHETGKTRGLLCWLCNSGIGKFKDNAQLLYKAHMYLREHDENNET